jgi:hypothetical protein
MSTAENGRARADLRTERDEIVWKALRAAAWKAAACVESIDDSGVDHVHADWRQVDKRCPDKYVNQK